MHTAWLYRSFWQSIESPHPDVLICPVELDVGPLLFSLLLGNRHDSNNDTDNPTMGTSAVNGPSNTNCVSHHDIDAHLGSNNDEFRFDRFVFLENFFEWFANNSKAKQKKGTKKEQPQRRSKFKTKSLNWWHLASINWKNGYPPRRCRF